MPPVFELRRDPVTGWWSAIVADRAFSREAVEVEAQPVEGTHCRHCDDADPADPPHHVRRVPLPPAFELRRDPVTGWWSAIVADRAFSREAFAVEAQPVEGTHCRHCDDADPDDPPHHVRRVPLRSDAFHKIDSSKSQAAQLS